MLGWLRRAPELIRNAAPGEVKVGLKLFNSLDDDAFQLAMLAEVLGPCGPGSSAPAGPISLSMPTACSIPSAFSRALAASLMEDPT